MVQGVLLASLITVTLRYVLKTRHDIVGDWSDEVADVLESWQHILSHWHYSLGNLIS